MSSAFGRFQIVSTQQLEEASPSRAHGIDWKTELSYRKVLSNLIYQTASGANYLKLNQFTAARAVTLFNRFYTRCSFSTNDRWQVAPACILLASKIDNCPRTAKDVATAFFVARCDKKHKHLIQKVHDPAWVEGAVQSLFDAERAVLFSLNFNFNVEIPHSWILPAVRKLGIQVPQGREAANAAETAAKELVTNAYSLLASSFCKDTAVLSVTQDADDVGKAALLTICMLCSFDLPLPAGLNFVEKFGTSPDTLVAICERLKQCFAPGTPGSKLTAEEVRAYALRRVPGTPAAEAAAGGAAAEGAAVGGAAEAAAAGGEAEAAAADSPPTAHDSASSHQFTAGTALASRKRGRAGEDEDAVAGHGSSVHQQRRGAEGEGEGLKLGKAWQELGADAKRVCV